MNSLYDFIRWPNMVIIIFTQYVFYQHVFCKILGGSAQMGKAEFIFILFNTLIITFSGYVINDYFDYETDFINRKRTALKSYPFSKNSLKLLYIVLSVIIVMSSILYGIYYEKLSKAYLFLIIHALLFLYSYQLKRYPLVGNLCVALLSAMVVFILYFFENTLWPLTSSFLNEPVYYIGVFYMLYAFFLSFIREMVKDIEDLAGDEGSGAMTFPIVVGIKKTLKTIVLSHSLLAFFSIILICLISDVWWIGLIYGVLFNLPFVFLIRKCLVVEDFNAKAYSLNIKYIMFTGVCFIFVYGIISNFI